MGNAPETLFAYSLDSSFGPQWRCQPAAMQPMTVFDLTQYTRIDVVDDLRINLDHWRHDVGKLHSQVDRLTAERDQAVAALRDMTAENARLVGEVEGADERGARIVEALFIRGVSHEKWPDYFRNREAGNKMLEARARAFLAGEGKV